MGWFRNQRRKKILEEAFPPQWEGFLEKHMVHYQYLDPSEQALLRDLVQIFIEEKSWEGCGGLELTEEIQVAIAGQANLLLLGLEGLEYKDVDAILIYPSAVKTPKREAKVAGNLVSDDSVAISGEALHGGPVLLTWDVVNQNGRHPERGHNVVYHEFAHKLDMLEGSVDGTPPMATKQELQTWVEVCTKEMEHLKSDIAHGRKTFLDTYAATNVGEFFAVATEAFFDIPIRMQHSRAPLYDVLADFYKQDPAERQRNFEQTKK